ncbi:GGDEF domain-containing protein [Geomonas subterranea]|uniref:diguanylate cyclase n=1 Tax=Geomonas subterranea TaxID=2847989 RepID=A0ABX8LED4_9BACT|nr:diguanylate cyclase [Geomonas subterranea]QXE90408.1 GGDEF domain-containing protein [Geomonas subterranea]QXM11517.1 GGDEF domain-containing protein [Geomonas subterranea]
MEMVQKARETLGEGGLKSVRFPEPLESAFDEYYRDKTLKHVRVALLTGLILYAVFGLVDGLLLPADRAHMWFIRYAVVCPTVIAGLAFTYLPHLRRFMQPVLSLVMLVGSLGIVSMVYYDPTPTKNYYYSGLLLLIMGAFTFVSLRLRYAVYWALATTLAYEAVAIYINHTDFTILTQNTFSIVATIIIGAFSNSLMENYLRRDFLNTNLLEHENRQLQKATLELRRLSISDPLTGLGNRRHFEVMLDQEWQRALRSESPIALIFLDIDVFKNFNDNYGHQAGDNCLKLVAQELGRFARRPGDTAARYGGEEFVLLLSGVGLADAATIAKGCRKAVEALQILHSHSPVAGVVTVSAGVAAMIPDLDADRQLLVEAADKALYRAKLKGRNMVVASSRQAEGRARQVYPQAASRR